MRRRLGGFFRLNPLLGGALAAIAGIVAIHVSPALGIVTALVLFFIAAWGIGSRAAIFVFLCAVIAGGAFWLRERDREKDGIWLTTGLSPQQLVTATLLADARPAANGWTGIVKLAGGGDFPAAKVWWVGEGAPPVQGAEVRARGRFVPPREPRNPGEFDQRSWLEHQGVAAVFLPTRGTGEVRTGECAALGSWIRKGFREAITTGLTEESQEAAVIRAVVIGEYPRDEDALVAAFRDSGTLHAFSVSGMHVAVVGTIGWLLLGRLGVPRRMAVPLLIAVMFGYSWLSGNSPPAVRSAWMGSVFLMAFFLRRQPNLLNALGAVLLVSLLWDGRLLFLPGVQLSYGVVAAIGLLGGIVSSWLGRFVSHDSYLPTVLLTPWQRRWYGGARRASTATAVAGVAWVGSTPLTLFHFGMTTPVAILAAIPMSIMIWWLLLLALLAAVVHPFSPQAARVVNQGNGRVASVCIGMAEWFAALPFGNLRTASAEPSLTVFDLDYGAGAACFSSAEGTVLLDCGDRRGFRRSIEPFLREKNTGPDAVVLSHPDAGHVGGGAELLPAYRVRQILLPVQRSRSSTYRTWFTAGPASGAKLLEARTGARLPLPTGAELEIVLAPDPAEWDAVADDRVAIYRLHWRGWKILFVNDAGLKTERRLLDSGVDLAADVLVAGHHRAGLSLGEEFVGRVAPQLIVATNTGYPPEEVRDAGQMGWWRGQGIRVFDQAETGAAVFRVERDGALRIDGFVNKESVRLTPR